jgi:succinate dehydrogenase/fumarate reductase flavoprotein subunit
MLYSGSECGMAVASAIRDADPQKNIDTTQVERYTADFLAPLNHTDGFSPYELLDRIQYLMSDMGRTICRSGDRIADSLAKTESIESSLPYQKATDMHGLFMANENRAMVLCSKLFFTASFLREETRGWLVREDFPERDDANWLKWIQFENKDDGIRVSYEPIPIEQYAVKPEKKEA